MFNRFPQKSSPLLSKILRKFYLCSFPCFFSRSASLLTFIFLSAILADDKSILRGLLPKGGNILKQITYSQPDQSPLFRPILRFSIPLMLTGLLQLAYNTADSVVVGRYAGSTSLAAVGATTSIIFLLVTLFNGVSIGTNYLTARYYGAGDQEAISQTVHWLRRPQRDPGADGRCRGDSFLHTAAGAGRGSNGCAAALLSLFEDLLSWHPRPGSL